MNSSLDFSQFKLTSATIEIRYDNAYILWDRAGLIWSEANLAWFGLKANQAEPNVTRFVINDRFDVMVSLDRSHLIDTKPTSSLKEFIEHAPTFLNLVMDSLNINKLERIGFRLIYKKYFKDKDTAAGTIIDSKIMTVPTNKIFNIQGKVLLPSYSFVWEGESTAAQIMLKAVDRKIDFKVPVGLEDEIPPVHLTKYEVIYDIDYYTIKTVSRGQFNVKDWIEQAYHLIKRDSKNFMVLDHG
jgi:hypothetical protein